MIPWPDDGPMHDPPRAEGCWGDRAGVDCGAPATINGLCGDCYVRITGERPTTVVQPAPPSEPFLTGSGRR